MFPFLPNIVIVYDLKRFKTYSHVSKLLTKEAKKKKKLMGNKTILCDASEHTPKVGPANESSGIRGGFWMGASLEEMRRWSG